MTDITERLRDIPRANLNIGELVHDAADEIDRLRARVAELEAADGICFTAMLVEIDGHAYGLRPGAARIVREALRDAGRYRWLRQPNALERAAHIAVLTHNGGYVATEASADSAIDAAMAKDGA